ncbi:hypothetical protein [Desulfovibrio intestinalis]|uniref:Uncharacterized protein YbaP (TraB family) n=1 Tax=Desulfovibrio intestinalis TaxID=58621 RepID=A0A7W8C2W1_9BACT|nr:hypothetical protein [Desulfovibrio intestinalis]MBB5144331.1 uncharacterized protein YbaP (TraB family) [Desulfovibrio intestinalis]
MFSASFTEKQQAVFLDVLDQLIMADGVRTSHEMFKFKGFQKQFSGVIAEHVPTEDLKNIFIDRKDRIAVMLELLSIPLAEGFVSEDDRIFLEKINQSLELEPKDMSWMTLWVENMLFLVSQATNFMEG